MLPAMPQQHMTEIYPINAQIATTSLFNVTVSVTDDLVSTLKKYWEILIELIVAQLAHMACTCMDTIYTMLMKLK